jgi:hypothetical protein
MRPSASKTIEFGDETFLIDTVVTTEVELTIAKIDYTFAGLRRPRDTDRRGLLCNVGKMALSEPTSATAEAESVTHLLPVGLQGEYELSPRFTLRGATQWFGIDTGDIEGRLLDTYIGVDYSFGGRTAARAPTTMCPGRYWRRGQLMARRVQLAVRWRAALRQDRF